MHKIIIAGLLFGLALTANAQMTPNPNDPNQQQTGVQTPGTPPTFPTDRQETAKDRQESNQADADTQNTDKDRDRTDRDEQYPQSTDRDQQNQQVQSDRDYDRDRQNGSIGSNAGQQDRERDMNDETDHNADYQSQLQKALQQNPDLSGVQVTYTDSTVELTGTVPTGKEKHEARMMAQDYANGRKVVDHVKVTGKGH